MNWDQFPVYLAAEVVGAVAAGVLYTALPTARPTTRRAESRRPPRPLPRRSPVVKKLINAPEEVLDEALAGMAAAHPELKVDADNKIIARADGPWRARWP